MLKDVDIGDDFNFMCVCVIKAINFVDSFEQEDHCLSSRILGVG